MFRLSIVLIGILALYLTPNLNAQHEGHGGMKSPPAATAPTPKTEHTAHDGMAGHEMQGGLPSWLPQAAGIVAAGLLLWVIVQSIRGKRPQWLNRQVVGGTLLLAAMYFATNYVVRKNKRPGQMTVIEAQGMDMTVMKPPVGAIPVVTEKAELGPFQATVSYTGTVVAFTDEDVYPRVTGWIRQMPVYPGDRVKPGQLLARLDSAELGSRVMEAAYGRLAAEQMREQGRAEQFEARAMKAEAEAEQRMARSGVAGGEREVSAAQAMAKEADRSLAGARAMVKEADSELEVARRGVSVTRSELDAKGHERETFEGERDEALAMVSESNREVDATQAEVTFWRENLKRSEALLKTGAISQQELDRDRADARTAEARWQSAQDMVRQKQALVRKAESHLKHLHAETEGKQSELAKMEAEVRRAQARVERARREAEAMEARVDQAESGTGAARARLAQMQAMAEKSQAAVRRAEAGLEVAYRKQAGAGATASQMRAAMTTASIVRGYTEIRANIGGVVTQRLVSPGVLVQPGMPILRVAQIDRVRLQANVAEADVAGIRPGNQVTVRNMKDRGLVVTTRVSSIFPSSDPTSRTVIVEAVTPNLEKRFVPGQFVSMEIATDQIQEAVTVPSTAIVEGQSENAGIFYTENRQAIWTVQTRAGTGKTEYYCPMHPEVVSDKAGTCPKCLMKLEPRTKGGSQYAHLVPVKVGPSTGTRTVIVSGLEGGEEVIVRGYNDLREGDAVHTSPTGLTSPTRPTESE